MLVAMRKRSPRVLSAITTSSRAALPALSPIPLTVHSTCRAPLRTASRLLATPRPRSLWQWTLINALEMLGTFFTILSISRPNSAGVA